MGELGPPASIWNEINIQNMDHKGVLAYEDQARRSTLKKKKRKSINFTVLSKSLLLYYLLFLVGLSHFYFWFTHNLHHVRLTILKCIINRHLAHLRCCATTKLYYFHEHTYTHIYTHTSAVTTWAPDGPPWSLILWSFSALKGTRLLQESPNP